MTAPIVVHHLENSRSQRVLWLLEELGLDYEVVRYARDRNTLLAPPALRAVHPLGRAPVVVDSGDVLAETGAIIETLLERHDAGATLVPPTGTAERLRWRYWLHFAEGSAMPPLLMSLVFARIRSAPLPFFVRPIARAIADRTMAGFVQPQIDANLAHMEAALSEHAWFAGDAFSAADIQMSFAAEAAAARTDLSARPRLQAWLERIHARPAYVRALARGGPYSLLR
ncbi:MAG TPA: glutathione S-transferase [Luteimonas sp.]|nr:glutathione S-transferase [Luteimonas sp.]